MAHFKGYSANLLRARSSGNRMLSEITRRWNHANTGPEALEEEPMRTGAKGGPQLCRKGKPAATLLMIKDPHQEGHGLLPMRCQCDAHSRVVTYFPSMLFCTFNSTLHTKNMKPGQPARAHDASERPPASESEPTRQSLCIGRAYGPTSLYLGSRSLKYGWASAALAEMRCEGSYLSICESRSMPCSHSLGATLMSGVGS